MSSQDLSYQFEVHCTVEFDSSLRPPPGFWQTTIRNFDKQGQLVQQYRLHTCRFRSLDEIPWHLKERYVRFKVERKIAKVLFNTGTIDLNEDYFLTPSDSTGIEIHIIGVAEDHLKSAVNDVAHQSLFLKRTQKLTRDELSSMIEQYRSNASKLYIEAVLYDNNEALDQDWQSACH